MRRFHGPLLAVLLFAPSAVVAQQAAARPAPAQSPRLKMDPQVTTGTLPNGMKYYIRENRRPEKRAELRLVVNAGSVLESDAQRGLAHFVEHMAFNGTRNFEKQALVNYLESIGMRFGADVNAFTSFDETVFMLTVPTDTGKTLERGLQILEDWSHDVTFDTEEIEKERGVVIEEWRLGRGAYDRMRDSIFPVLFNNSRYAERLPIGRREVLQSFAPDTLRAFYKRWYRPDLMAVVAVGDFDRAVVEKMIREHFSRVPARKAAPRPLFDVPPHATPRVAIATDKEATATQVALYRLAPARSSDTEAAYRRGLVEQLHNSMLNMRLAELTQQSDPPYINAFAGKGRFVRTAEVYTLAAIVKDDGIERGLATLIREAQRAARHGFTQTELDRAKRNMLTGYENAYAERDKTYSEELASELVRSYLEKEPVPGIEAEYALARRFVPAITLAEVNALTRGWLEPSNSVLIVQAPQKSDLEIPSKEQLLAIEARVRKDTVSAYTDRVATGPLVSNQPTGGRITETKTTPEIGLTEWRLSNGVRVLLRPTDFQKDEVLLRAFSPGGTSLASDADFNSARFADLLVRTGGVGRLSAIELSKALAGKNARVGPFISDMDEGFSGSGSPKDLDTMLQLVYLYFTAPRLDTAAVQSMLSRMRASLENRGADPQSAFSDTIQLTMAQHHLRDRPLTVTALDQVQLGRAFEFYRERFADASDFTFVLVGSFTPDSIRPLVEKWLGGLPALHRTESGRDVGIRAPEGVIRKAVRKGVEPKSQTMLIYSGGMTYNPRERRVLRMLGEVLGIRLREALREDKGGTYGVRVAPVWQKQPVPNYSFTIDFGSAPERVDELVQAVFTEIDSLRVRGPLADVLEKVKETERRSLETSMKQNGYWLSSIVTRERTGEDQRDILAMRAAIDSVTVQDIRAAAQLYLRPDNYVLVSLYPEKTEAMNEIAREYVGLVLAVGEHDAGYVDAYYGPSDIQESVKREKPTLPVIRARADSLLARLSQVAAGSDELERLRHQFLTKQLQSLVARVEMLQGRKFTFDEESKALYDAVAPTHTAAHFEQILQQLDRQLPGSGALIDRLESFRGQFVIPREKLDTVFRAAITEARRRTKQHVALPEGESFVVEYVTNKPWSGYNWYKGNAHSVIQVNTDLPIFIDRAIDLAAHEGYPGHHVYNALLEKALVRDRGWIEYSVYPLFSPQSLIAEGSANYGVEMAFPGEERTRFEREVLYPLAGLDPTRAGQYAQVQSLVAQLSYAGNEAARRYLNGEIDADEAAAWITKYALMAPERAKQRVRFIDTYRSYVINYNLGQDLVRAYVERTAGSDPVGRWAVFAGLLSSPRLPSGLR